MKMRKLIKTALCTIVAAAGMAMAAIGAYLALIRKEQSLR